MKLNEVVKNSVIYQTVKDLRDDIICCVERRPKEILIELKIVSSDIAGNIKIEEDRVLTELVVNGTSSKRIFTKKDLLHGEENQYKVNNAVRFVINEVVKNLLWFKEFYKEYRILKNEFENRTAFTPMGINKGMFRTGYRGYVNHLSGINGYGCGYSHTLGQVCGVEMDRYSNRRFEGTLCNNDVCKEDVIRNCEYKGINDEADDFVNINKIIEELNKFSVNKKFSRCNVKHTKSIEVSTMEIINYELIKMLIKEIIRLYNKFDVKLLQCQQSVICHLIRQPISYYCGGSERRREIVSINLNSELFEFRFGPSKKGGIELLREYLDDLENIELILK